MEHGEVGGGWGGALPLTPYSELKQTSEATVIPPLPVGPTVP